MRGRKNGIGMGLETPEYGETNRIRIGVNVFKNARYGWMITSYICVILLVRVKDFFFSNMTTYAQIKKRMRKRNRGGLRKDSNNTSRYWS